MLRAGGGGGGLLPTNNLSDVANAATALANLGGLSVLNNYLVGYTLSNDGVTPNTKLDVAAGFGADSTNVAMIAGTAGAIDCTTVGANGLDVGSLANNTWYHAFVIAKAGGASPAFLASTSVSSPTLPATYILKRRLMSFLTDGSAHILPFTQVEDTVYWSAIVQDLSNYTLVTNPGELKTFTVPTGVAVRPIIRVGINNGSLHAQVISPNESAVAVPASEQGTNGEDFDGNFNAGGIIPGHLYTNTAAQLRIIGSAASAGFYAWTRGWIDSRGRL